jgi:SAM-dependent methyltransferase
MDAVQLQEGMAYAEGNLQTNNGFSKLDKQLISDNFDLRGKEVLDFGCGMGHMSLWFAHQLGANVYGVDIDENHITVSRELLKKYPTPKVSFNLRNIILEPVDREFDFIFLNDVIEHIRDEWLQEVLDVLINFNLKKGGVIFFSYPPWEGPHASHLQPATRIPWVQFLPRRFVIGLVKRHNQQLVGKHDLLTEYLELNKMSHSKLSKLLSRYPLRRIFRRSHTKFNVIPFLRNINLNFFPFKFIVTKELIAFRKEG